MVANPTTTLNPHAHHMMQPKMNISLDQSGHGSHMKDMMMMAVSIRFRNIYINYENPC